MRRFIKKKNILFLLILIGIFGISFSAFALELDWPVSPGGAWLNDNSTLTDLIAYIYEWAMTIGGIATFIALISAGFQYLTSAGNVTKMSDAKQQITSAITGLVLLLSTFLILSTINPELTTLEIPEISLSGASFDALDPENVSLTRSCEIAHIYPNTGFSGSYTQIAKGSYESVTIEEGEGSIKLLYMSADGNYEEGGYCIVELYDNSNCDDDPITAIFSTQSDLYSFHLEQIDCVLVK